MSNVNEFGAVGDGQADDTEAVQHALNDGDGIVEFPRGEYRITRTLNVDLAERSRTALHGSGGVAKLIMDGPGPAVLLKGTHQRSADPTGFRPEQWMRERMPTVSNLEIEGRHEEADGIRIIGVVQPTLTGLLIRGVRTAVHITERARNVIIDHCHFYHNTGVGVHLDGVNLHQIIISDSHISYCRLGGIRVENSEIRNLQITGNDIEYNNNRAHRVPGADDLPTAEIYIDVGDGSVREGTIVSNTIQATYSPGGANIRFIGRHGEREHLVGMWTITGNLIGSQANNIHLTSVRGVTINGNYIYSGHVRNLLVEDCRNVVVGPNTFGHNPDYRDKELATGIRFVDSENCNLSGLLIQDAQAGRHTVDGAPPLEREGLIEFVRCRRVNVSGVQALDGTPYGLFLEDCHDVLITGCMILDQRRPRRMRAAIVWRGAGRNNFIGHCRLGTGDLGAIVSSRQVRVTENLVVD